MNPDRLLAHYHRIADAPDAIARLRRFILRSLTIPLPSLAEQHRIVAKVDELMALCDKLEASLAASTAARRRLLDALLAEAIAPTFALEREAAE
jgi:type I restriction enzyme, S subunit